MMDCVLLLDLGSEQLQIIIFVDAVSGTIPSWTLVVARPDRLLP